MNWLTKIIFSFLKDVADGILIAVGGAINNIFKTMYELNLKFNFNKLTDYTLLLGLALLSFLAVKQAISVYGFQTDGDPDSDPLELITRICISVAVMVCGSWIIQEFIKLAGIITDEVNKQIIQIDDDFTSSASDMLISFAAGGITALIDVVLLIIVIVSVIVLCVKAAKRGAELILFSILLPLVACDLITTSREKWNSFFSELLICIFGYITQLLCFNIFMFFFIRSTLNYNYMFVSLAWILLVLGAPKWIQKFMYSSGAGNAAKGVARTGAYMLPNLIRLGK